MLQNAVGLGSCIYGLDQNLVKLVLGGPLILGEA